MRKGPSPGDIDGGFVKTGTAGLTLVAMVFFASNSLLCRAALGGELSDAISFTTLRLFGGALALGAIVRLRSREGTGGRPGGGGLLPAVALFAYAIGFSLAYLRIAAGTGALLLFAAVQVTMLGAGLLAGERPRPREWIGLLLSVGGLIALTRPGLEQPDLVGAGLMIGAGIAWGVYSLRGRGVADALAANAANFVGAVPLALAGSVGGLVLGGAGNFHLTTAGALLALISGGITSGVGYAIWYAALRGLTATQASLVQLSVPPLAAVGGVLVLGEALTGRLILASIVILGGIALAVTARR
jgi:drug/metabolite transporter (DMT)-like permease